MASGEYSVLRQRRWRARSVSNAPRVFDASAFTGRNNSAASHRLFRIESEVRRRRPWIFFRGENHGLFLRRAAEWRGRSRKGLATQKFSTVLEAA